MPSINLRDRRLELGLTLEEVGKAVGVGKSTVRKWEQGMISNMGRDKIVSLSKVLKISPIEILGINQDDDIYYLYNRLTNDNKGKVYSYTESLLDQQNNVIDYPSVNEDETRYRIKCYGAVSAGTGETLEEEHVEYIDHDKAVPEHDFALRVNGNSMEPTLQDNEIIFIRRASEPEYNGQIVIAILNGDGYVKKYYEDESGVRLISLNSEYEDIVIHEYDDLQIKGIVIL